MPKYLLSMLKCMLRSLCEAWLDWRLHIFQVAVCTVLYGYMSMSRRNCLSVIKTWMCIGIYRSKVYPLDEYGKCMVESSASLMCINIFLRSSTGSTWGDSIHSCGCIYVIHCMHCATLSHVIKGISEVCQNGAECEVQFVGSSGWCRVSWWCCRVWWDPDVSFLLHPSLGWYVVCSPAVAYLVIFKTDMMCTRVSCCLCCIAMSWLTLFLILLTSLVAAVPVSQA